MKQSRVFAAVFAGVLAAVVAAESQAQVAAGASVAWGWPGHGRIGPWASCGAGACVDSPHVRRAIRRELEQFEHLRELEERAQGGFPSAATPLYGLRRDWVPPTPEAQVQPAYRDSGEIRPEFSRAGQPRQDSAGPPR